MLDIVQFAANTIALIIVLIPGFVFLAFLINWLVD